MEPLVCMKKRRKCVEWTTDLNGLQPFDRFAAFLRGFAGTLFAWRC